MSQKKKIYLVLSCLWIAVSITSSLFMANEYDDVLPNFSLSFSVISMPVWISWALYWIVGPDSFVKILRLMDFKAAVLAIVFSLVVPIYISERECSSYDTFLKCFLDFSLISVVSSLPVVVYFLKRVFDCFDVDKAFFSRSRAIIIFVIILGLTWVLFFVKILRYLLREVF